MKNGNTTLEKILSKLRYRNVIISISHSNYKIELGGTEKVLCEEQNVLFENHISYMNFFPRTNGLNGPIDIDIQYFGMIIDGEFIDYFNINQSRGVLYFLKKININFLGINIHHTLGINIKTLESLIDNISDNIKFFLHDYYSSCPQFNFLKNNQIYCGNMHEDKCLDCIYGEERKRHLDRFRYFFNKYDITFIAPSQVAKDIWTKTYDYLSDKVRVIPHQVLKGSYRKNNISQGKIKLAYIGNESFNKGWDIWRFIAKNIDIDKYELYNMGSCSQKIENVNNIKVSFHDKGKDAMLEALRRNNVDLVFLWSICPETYSFTYFESYAAGAFVITNRCSGNIAHQVIKNKNGIILDDKYSVYRFLVDRNNVLESLKQNTMLDFPLTLDTNTELLDEIKNLIH